MKPEIKEFILNLMELEKTRLNQLLILSQELTKYTKQIDDSDFKKLDEKARILKEKHDKTFNKLFLLGLH